MKYHKNALLWSRDGYSALDGAMRLFRFKAVLAGRRDAKPVRWRFGDGPPDLEVIYFAAPQARASDKPHDLDTKASRCYCSLLFPTNPLFIYKGEHLRWPWRRAEVLFASWQPLCLSAGISGRRWFVLWVPSAYANGQSGLAVGPINRLIE